MLRVGGCGIPSRATEASSSLGHVQVPAAAHQLHATVIALLIAKRRMNKQLMIW